MRTDRKADASRCAIVIGRTVLALNKGLSSSAVSTHRPVHPVAVAGLSQKLAELLQGQGREGGVSRGYLAQKIKMVSDEYAKVPREGRLVDADEVPALQSAMKEGAPLFDGYETD